MNVLQYSGGYSVRRRHIINKSERYLVQMCHIISMEEVYDQYSGGQAGWTCIIISTEVVQYMATKTAQGVVGGCIYLRK